MSTYIISDMMLVVDILLRRTAICALYMSCKRLYARIPPLDVIILSAGDEHAAFYDKCGASDVPAMGAEHGCITLKTLSWVVMWGDLALYTASDSLSKQRLYTIGGHPYRSEGRYNTCPIPRCRVFSVQIKRCLLSATSNICIAKYDIINDIHYTLDVNSWAVDEAMRQIYDYSGIPYGPDWGYLKVSIGKRSRRDLVIYGAEVSRQYGVSPAAIKAHNYYDPRCSKEVDAYINSRIEPVFTYMRSTVSVDSRPFMGGQVFIDMCTKAYNKVVSRT